MNYAEAIQFLYDLQLFGARPGLETTLELAARSGNPHDKLRFIHVAGTNGKGSTCAMLESIYRMAGLRVGLFISPHLVAFGERIQVNRRPISEADVVRLVAELRSRAGVPPAPRAHLREQLEVGSGHVESGRRDACPTFFEFVTVMALCYFAEQKCDLVIWETGLGGRLDATNIVTPLASVITNIQFDHQQWLGDTLEKIAAEKAGIIKPGVPVLTAVEDADAFRVLFATARKKKAPFWLVSRGLAGAEVASEDHANVIHSSPALPSAGERAGERRLNSSGHIATNVGQASRLSSPSTSQEIRITEAGGTHCPTLSSRADEVQPQHEPAPSPHPNPLPSLGGSGEGAWFTPSIKNLPAAQLMDGVTIPLAGEHQRLNAALAAWTVKVLHDKIPVPDAVIRAGLARVEWPGRFQVVEQPGSRTLVLDGAHNIGSAEALRAAFLARFGARQPTLVLGILQDKDVEPMCAVLAPLAGRILVAPVSSRRSADPTELAAVCRRANPAAEVAEFRSLREALERAAADPLVLITGSLYLIGEALELCEVAPAKPRDERRLNEWGGKPAGTQT